MRPVSNKFKSAFKTHTEKPCILAVQDARQASAWQQIAITERCDLALYPGKPIFPATFFKKRIASVFSVVLF